MWFSSALLLPFLFELAESRTFIPLEQKRERELMCAVSEKDQSGGECTSSSYNCECYAHPDPHFKTWDGTYFDYHGGCDLVFIKHENLNIHIRTLPLQGYASVSHAAVEIGGKIFEVDDTCSMKLNGNSISSPPSTLGTAEIVYNNYSNAKRFEIIVVGGAFPQTVELTCYKSYQHMGVTLHANLSPQSFEGTEGICGSLYGLSGPVCRDGCKGCIDYDCLGTSYGEDWQVDPDEDGTLLSNPDTTECSPPIGDDPDRTCTSSKDRIRRLESERFNENLQTCAEVIPEGAPDALFENCAYDLTATNYTTFLELPFYEDPVELKPNDEPRCSAVGTNCVAIFGLFPGECIYGGCDRSKYLCSAELCCDTQADQDCSNSETLAAQDSCMCAIEIALLPSPINTIVSIVVQILLTIEDLTGFTVL